MGTSRSAEELGAKLGKLAVAISTANRDAVEQSALAFKAAYAVNLGKFATMRNIGKKGVKVRAHYDIKGLHGNPTALIKAIPGGAAAIAERGAGAHLVGVRARGGKTMYGTRRNRQGGRKFIRFASGDVRLGPVFHPGMSGTQPWARTKKQMEFVTPAVFARNQKIALAKVFGLGG